jgi:hypothetical protein
MAKRKKLGRPTVDTPETRRKIEEVAALDGSVEEIAFYAEISQDSYYEILKRDPKFSERIKALRNRPVLKARQTAIKTATLTRWTISSARGKRSSATRRASR